MSRTSSGGGFPRDRHIKGGKSFNNFWLPCCTTSITPSILELKTTSPSPRGNRWSVVRWSPVMFFSSVVSPVVNGDGIQRGDTVVTPRWMVTPRRHHSPSRFQLFLTTLLGIQNLIVTQTYRAQSTNKDFCLVNLCAFLQLWFYLTHWIDLFKIIPALKSIKKIFFGFF